MKINSSAGQTLADIPTRARALEEIGVHALTSAEVSHDSFLPLVLAAEHTERVQLMTGITVAFARNPMALATVAHDLNAYSQGRFMLGLGSQVKSHIQWRFGMPWSAPARRMKEYVEALHAVWDSWYDEKPLNFKGEFYTHSLMTPRFTPEDRAFGRPKIAVAAVGPLMTKTAAEVADAVICHAFTTERYLREVTLPAIEATLKQNGRDRAKFEVIYPPFVSIVADDTEMEKARQSLRGQIAFYASTPAYRGVLELHGWGELQTELQAYVKAGRWSEMGELVDDQVFAAFAIWGDARQVGDEIAKRFGGLIDRISIGLEGLSQHDAAALVDKLAAA
jgi:probable F420-dependent oxidoreductase